MNCTICKKEIMDKYYYVDMDCNMYCKNCGNKIKLTKNLYKLMLEKK